MISPDEEPVSIMNAAPNLLVVSARSSESSVDASLFSSTSYSDDAFAVTVPCEILAARHSDHDQSLQATTHVTRQTHIAPDKG